MLPGSGYQLKAAEQGHRYSHGLVSNVLRLLWVVIVIAGELGAFYWSLAGCRWPAVTSGHVGRSNPVVSMMVC